MPEEYFFYIPIWFYDMWESGLDIGFCMEVINGLCVRNFC